MSITGLFVAVSTGVAVTVVTGLLRPRTRTFADRRGDRSSWLEAVLRFAVVNGMSAANAQTRFAVRIAPLDAPGTAFEFDCRIDGELRRLGVLASSVREMHIWVRGRELPVVCGDQEVSALRSLAPEVAAWELEIATASGNIIRCYGEDITAAIEDDLARLRRLVAAFAVGSGSIAAQPDRGGRSDAFGVPEWAQASL
jgi:hypothetical protein